MDETIGSIIKSPLQLLSEICSMFSVTFPNATTDTLNYYKNFFYDFIHNDYFKASGMDFFNPHDVAGFHAYYQEPDFDRYWFSSNTIIGRYQIVESLIQNRNTIGSGDSYASLDTVLFVKDKITNALNPNLLISEIADLLYPESIDADRINYFKNFLVDQGFEDSNWTGIWLQYLNDNDDISVRIRLNALITAMVNAPEFQLM